jgi:hypothetical protein
MTVHIIKLCVGVDALSELAAWQAERLKDLKRKNSPLELTHITRQMPRRTEDVLDGGSLYWVIKGRIAARQRLLELRPVTRDGVPHCALVYDRNLIPVHPRPRRAFQGWRYLDPKDAPPDLAAGDDIQDMPEDMRDALTDLGLL